MKKNYFYALIMVVLGTNNEIGHLLTMEKEARHKMP